MTVGLIRGETAGDLRTLAATGASSATRRTLNATSAGALALLGGILGTAAAYLALIAWHWHDISYLEQAAVRQPRRPDPRAAGGGHRRSLAARPHPKGPRPPPARIGTAADRAHFAPGQPSGRCSSSEPEGWQSLTGSRRTVAGSPDASRWLPAPWASPGDAPSSLAMWASRCTAAHSAAASARSPRMCIVSWVSTCTASTWAADGLHAVLPEIAAQR